MLYLSLSLLLLALLPGNGAAASTAFMAPLRRIVMFHGTSKAACQSISEDAQSTMRPGENNVFGVGVYFGKNIQIAQNYARDKTHTYKYTGCIIKAEVRVLESEITQNTVNGWPTNDENVILKDIWKQGYYVVKSEKAKDRNSGGILEHIEYLDYKGVQLDLGETKRRRVESVSDTSLGTPGSNPTDALNSITEEDEQEGDLPEAATFGSTKLGNIMEEDSEEEEEE